MAEGIVGSAPSTYDQSYLMSLCEAGQQYVTATRVHKKNVELMFGQGNSGIRNLDEVVTTPDVCDRTVRWFARYLVDKADETQL